MAKSSMARAICVMVFTLASNCWIADAEAGKLKLQESWLIAAYHFECRGLVKILPGQVFNFAAQGKPHVIE